MKGIVKAIIRRSHKKSKSLLAFGGRSLSELPTDTAEHIQSHNHPSGDPSSSPDDIVVTRLMVEAGRLFDIQRCDPLVIGAGRFVSLKERDLDHRYKAISPHLCCLTIGRIRLNLRDGSDGIRPTTKSPQQRGLSCFLRTRRDSNPRSRP